MSESEEYSMPPPDMKTEDKFLRGSSLNIPSKVPDKPPKFKDF